MSNYYITLGISRDAETEKIKKAYRMSCKKYHPDKNPEAKHSYSYRYGSLRDFIR
jgi:molecular chaperone DnaJ